MAVIRPFSCIRPTMENAAVVASRPYDVFSEEEARQAVGRNPHSILTITRPETQFPAGTDPAAPEVYAAAGERLEAWIRQGILEDDREPSYYIYEVSVGAHQQTGLVGCASVDDYWNHRVKAHEAVRTKKLEDRTRHIEACAAQTGPVFLASHSSPEITNTLAHAKLRAPLYSFTSEEGVGHRVWKLSDPAIVASLERKIASLGPVYIADGHHRAFAAARVCEKMRKANPDYTGEEPFNYFLCAVFPEDELQILAYNRVLSDLNGLGTGEFLARVEESFDVRPVGTTAFYPKFKGIFGMYLDGCWYMLSARKTILSQDPVDGLDVSLLQNHLLGPVLGVEDPRTDPRLDFIGGIRGFRALEERCQEDMRLAFALHPTSIRELFAVADADRLMPPKSTWFEPKLASGLFIHRISGAQE
ncbi:MAG: DUF1015 domain-containing protein [Lachnospiraceae bacterium]|nr:DUF1015 domain-containing protein [Lachnospiraceae bacterium]